MRRKGGGWVEGNKSAAVAAAPRRGPAERERNGEATPPPAKRPGGWCGEAIALERSRAKRPPRQKRASENKRFLLVLQMMCVDVFLMGKRYCFAIDIFGYICAQGI